MLRLLNILLILLLILAVTTCRYGLLWLLIHIVWLLSLNVNRLVKVLSSWSHVRVEAVVEHVAAIGLLLFIFFLLVLLILVLLELVHWVVLVIHFWSVVMLLYIYLLFVLWAVVGIKRVALDESAVGEGSVAADRLALRHQRTVSPWRCMLSNSIVEISYLLLQVLQLLF